MMNIQELRNTRARLEHLINYCPPDSAPDHVWARSEEAAIKADEQWHQLQPVFALLDAIDELTARLERLERLTGHYVKAWEPREIPGGDAGLLL